MCDWTVWSNSVSVFQTPLDLRLKTLWSAEWRRRSAQCPGRFPWRMVEAPSPTTLWSAARPAASTGSSWRPSARLYHVSAPGWSRTTSTSSESEESTNLALEFLWSPIPSSPGTPTVSCNISLELFLKRQFSWWWRYSNWKTPESFIITALQF